MLFALRWPGLGVAPLEEWESCTVRRMVSQASRLSCTRVKASNTNRKHEDGQRQEVGFVLCVVSRYWPASALVMRSRRVTTSSDIRRAILNANQAL